jgi:hypothetical protein
LLLLVVLGTDGRIVLAIQNILQACIIGVICHRQACKELLTSRMLPTLLGIHNGQNQGRCQTIWWSPCKEMLELTQMRIASWRE